VLQQLVSMNHIEGCVGKPQVIDISDSHAEIIKASFSGQPPCFRNCGWRRVNANDGAIRQPVGEIDGYRPWANADIKQPVRRFEPGQQVRRGIVGGTPLVRSKD